MLQQIADQLPCPHAGRQALALNSLACLISELCPSAEGEPHDTAAAAGPLRQTLKWPHDVPNLTSVGCVPPQKCVTPTDTQQV